MHLRRLRPWLRPCPKSGVTCPPHRAFSLESINVDGASKILGPYSHAVVATQPAEALCYSVHLTGHLGKDSHGKLVEGGIASQTRKALETIQLVLKEASASISDISKCTVLLADFDDYKAMNQAYEEFFAGHVPARTCYGVDGLPGGALVEIQAIAHLSRNAASSAGTPLKGLKDQISKLPNGFGYHFSNVMMAEMGRIEQRALTETDKEENNDGDGFGDGDQEQGGGSGKDVKDTGDQGKGGWKFPW